MTQRDRDRLVVLKKAQKKLITQRQAVGELQLSERHVRRMLLKGHQRARLAGCPSASIHPRLPGRWLTTYCGSSGISA
jgi:hypothetical protein